MSDPPTPTKPEGDSPGMHEAARREKLRQLLELGIDPWGQRFDGHRPIAEIRAREAEITVVPTANDSQSRGSEQHGLKVRAAGRIVLQRPTGKLIFANIRDSSADIQILVGRSQVGDDNWA